MIKKKEINDLYDYKKLKIVQNKDYFKFSVDSLLLAEFIKILPSTKLVVDFCTGNAPIPLILSKNKEISIIGIELQKEIFDLAEESVNINDISNISLINDNVKNAMNHIKANSVDIISCNPPYFKYSDKSIVNDNIIKTIARHEAEVTLLDIISVSKKLLKTNGKLYLIHRVNRLEEIIKALNEKTFAVKQLQFIYSNDYKDAIMVLIEASNNGSEGLKVLKPIFLNEVQTFQNMFK